jgi:hypothetical protein
MVQNMQAFLYIYDCKQARKSNARRVSFTKELYGFSYVWQTKSGIKEGRRLGLLDECVGARSVAESTIVVPGECKGLFDNLFELYNDILTIKIFEIARELQ